MISKIGSNLHQMMNYPTAMNKDAKNGYEQDLVATEKKHQK